MPVVFRCECGKYLSVRSKNVGRRVRCPVCGEENRVPDPKRKKSRRIRNVPTRELNKEEFRRLREAHDSGDEVALDTEEMKCLDLESQEIKLPEEDSDRDGKSEKKRSSRKRRKDGKRASAKKEKISGNKVTLLVCFCGTELDASDREPGEVFPCSICGRTVTVPGASSDRLELAPVEDKDRCAECGVEIEEEQRICHSCGNEIVQRLL
ncbi:MAG: hypothetical protein QF752_13350 [Planctomycetota bacterium]|jgi:hypothetical protein|nr:hypothetical protein [Planctomycetota bacterium]